MTMASTNIAEAMPYPNNFPKVDSEEDLMAIRVTKKNPVRTINLLCHRMPSESWLLTKVIIEMANIQINPLSFFQRLSIAFMAIAYARYGMGLGRMMEDTQ